MGTEHYGAHQASWPGDAPPDWQAQNKGITPIFYIDKVELLNGDTLDIECCTIRIAEDSLTEAAVIVDDAVRERFEAQYTAWKAGKELCSGTPLEDFGLLSPKQITELEANGVYSVDDLGSMSDGNCGCVPHGRMLRDKAAAWLAKQAADAPGKKMAEDNAALQKQIDELRAKLTAPASPRKRKAWTARERAAASEKSRAIHAARKAAVPCT